MREIGRRFAEGTSFCAPTLSDLAIAGNDVRRRRRGTLPRLLTLPVSGTVCLTLADSGALIGLLCQMEPPLALAAVAILRNDRALSVETSARDFGEITRQVEPP